MLNKALSEINIELSQKQIEQLNKFYELLVEKNKVMNLTGITEYNEVLEKHFLDSALGQKAVDFNKNLSVIDVGTGAGFPGIPLKIMFPNLKITLLDSLNKRINFLSEVVEKLGLEDVELIHGRAEDIARNPQYRENYDIVVSRAVANLSTLCEYCLPFAKIGGKFLSYKGEKASEEIKETNNCLNVLGGKIEEVMEYKLPVSRENRALVLIDKVDITPEKYPRKAGIPVKKPL